MQKIGVEFFLDTILESKKKPNLFITLATITVSAKHLTVFCVSLATLRPRSNVVGFHFIDLEMIFADRTYSFLLLICFTLHIVREGANV